MEQSDLLRIINDFGVKSVPFVGDYLAEVIKDAVGGITADKLDARLNTLKALMNGQESTLGYLIRRVDRDGLLAAEFADPLRELAHAVENPHDPNLPVKNVIDRLASRFENAEQLVAWLEVEYRNVGVRLTLIEAELKAITPRKVDSVIKRQILDLFGGCLPKSISVICGIGNPEAQSFASEIIQFFQSQGIQSKMDHVMGEPPEGLMLAKIKRRLAGPDGKPLLDPATNNPVMGDVQTLVVGCRNRGS